MRKLHFLCFQDGENVVDFDGAVVGKLVVGAPFVAFPGGENIPAELLSVILPTGEWVAAWRHSVPAGQANTCCICEL